MEAVRQRRALPLYRFGPFVLDGTKCVLARNGDAVPLSLKAFEILLLLVQHSGEVLEKDQLLKEIWPDTVVEENNLARNISALRKALDEHPSQHQYILTIPGRGYRFVAEVQEVETGGQEAKQQSPQEMSPLSSRVVSPLQAASPVGAQATGSQRFPRSLLSVLAILVTGIVLTSITLPLIIGGSGDNRQSPQRRLWQLTFDPGLESEPTWSPDGRMIAYSSDRSGNFDIWVQPVGEGDAVRVTTSPAHDWEPDWAPDGNRLVFRSERDGGGLFVVPVLGGNERKISSFGYRPRWSPDGPQVLFYSSILRNNLVEIPKVYLVGLDGRPPREVLAGFLSEFISLRVAWHPDAQRVSLWGNHRQQGWSFWTVPVEGGAPVKSDLAAAVKDQVKESAVSFTDFVWSPSKRTLYFEGVAQSVRNFWKVDVDPQTLRWIGGLERLTTGTGLDTDMAISRDGKKLAFTERSERTRLWSLPFDTATGRSKGAGQPITAAGIEATHPDISQDGKKLLFRAERAGRQEIWEKSLSDGREHLLVSPDDNSRFLMRWSRDGSRLSYTRLRPANPEHPENEMSIIVMPAGGGDEQMLTTPGPTSELAWDWSTDGKWILGGFQRPTPERRIICLLPTGGSPHAEDQMRIVTSHPDDNLYQARFSPDNRWVSFCAAKATEGGVSTVYVVPLSGGEWTRITEGKYFDDKPRWSMDGKILYFVSNRTGFFHVWGIRFDPAKGQPVGEPFRVTAFEGPGQMILFDVRSMEMALSADRLILPIMDVSGGIWILENTER